METKISDKAPHQLLVEGTHDKYVVIHLMERHGLRWEPKTPAPYVRECKSYQKLLSELPGIIKG